jgi:hypothetical protein
MPERLTLDPTGLWLGRAGSGPPSGRGGRLRLRTGSGRGAERRIGGQSFFHRPGALRQGVPPSKTQTPVSVLLDGRELSPADSGAAPNLSGVCQVNVQIPFNAPRGAGRLLVLKQTGILSPAVKLAVE